MSDTLVSLGDIMIHKIIRPVVCVIAFILTIFFLNKFMNVGNEELTAEMSECSLPVVYMMNEDVEFNSMEGYKATQNPAYMAQTITPLSEGRSLNIKIDKYDNVITDVSFEVRSNDGSRLIEDTSLTSFVENNDNIVCSFSLKDLIEENEEYAFVIRLSVKDVGDVYYYARIIQNYSLDYPGKLNFCRDFSDRTFSTDENEAKEIILYLESDATGDNSDYANVNIHSSFDQITWGDLNINKTSDTRAYIEDIGSGTASLRLEYTAEIKNEKSSEKLLVKEYFRIRQGDERMYLLDYERKAVKLFSDASNAFFGKKIMLGIGDSDIALAESEKGKVTSFVWNGSLYSCMPDTDCFTTVFSFAEKDTEDIRTLTVNHGIKILSVDEGGDVSFLVYGYFPRGVHEGQMGMSLYKYSYSLNSVEECFFLPYDKSFSILKSNVEKLSFLNNDGRFYFFLEGSIYSVDCDTWDLKEIVSDLSVSSFTVSEDNSMGAWLTGKDIYSSNELMLMNFSSGICTSVKAGANNKIYPLGFMDRDLIYGQARRYDIHKNEFGETVFPMYSIKIRDEQGNILKDYSPDGYYVVDYFTGDNMLTLIRMSKNDNDEFVSAPPDSIINNSVKETKKNNIETPVTENLKKIVQIVLSTEMKDRGIRKIHPKFVLYEGNKNIEPELSEKLDFYFVFVHSEITSFTENAGDAVKEASETNGLVRDGSGNVVWRKENLLPKNQIMAITGTQKGEEDSNLSVCLETILRYNGINLNVNELLEDGLSPEEILKKGLPDYEILDLSGCETDSVLYYVNKDIPVLAFDQNGEAVLIVGFNELNLVWMNPESGNVYKVGRNDSAEAFEKGGKVFLSYLPVKNE